MVCAFITPRSPVLTEHETKSRLREVIKTPVFRYMYISGLLNTLALFFPFVFLAPYARAQGINNVAAASLVGIIGGASIIGRLGFGALGDRVSRIRLFQTTFFIVNGLNPKT